MERTGLKTPPPQPVEKKISAVLVGTVLAALSALPDAAVGATRWTMPTATPYVRIDVGIAFGEDKAGGGITADNDGWQKSIVTLAVGLGLGCGYGPFRGEIALDYRQI